MTTLALIVGFWSTTCIQTQINGNNQGHAIESYIFHKNGDYEFIRSWFEDAECKIPKAEEEESGTLKLGNKLSGMFIQGETFEADFTSQSRTDLGTIQITSNGELKIARGFKGSTMRNTMVGIFQYKKQD